MLDAAAVALDEFVLLLGQGLLPQLFLGNRQQLIRNLGQAVHVLLIGGIQHAVSLQPLDGQAGQVPEPGVHQRFRLHIAPEVVLLVAAAHLRHHLFGVKNGVMFQLGEAARKALQALLHPLLALHEHRIALSPGLQQGP